MYKAMLVDDESFDLLGLEALIPWASLRIEIVYSTSRPIAALQYASEHPLDILITDIRMPVLTGLELARRLKEPLPELRTLFLSGYEDFGYAREALALKADGYILKPVDDDEIMAALAGIVSQLDAARTGRLVGLPPLRAARADEPAAGASDGGELLERLADAVRQYRLVDICDLAAELLRLPEAREPGQLQPFALHAVSRLEGYVDGAGAGAGVAAGAPLGVARFGELGRLTRPAEVESWVRLRAFELSERIRSRRAWRLLPDIEAYVRERLATPLTLREVALRFAYSPSHFGVLFKERTGVAFNEFLARERMERARELLVRPGFKVYEIAEQVGYNSLPYFIRTFRELYGVTPGDYRRQA
ncbi:helix-turn-helix domain-containing protein [Paenibacillus albicereus]|uniref:Helix-turn-helix domain-containing protein n=1 Tax=Paenibacillus albicereus TaxID=2726185 RepID=A0A6H2H140_9BACL|nr:helix-turn-helix domain-containing protein [Paenibacillus albicereus]QJC53136.1 helix-turn-helix domain-containing protein [Paenibacillus albicereus]